MSTLVQIKFGKKATEQNNYLKQGSATFFERWASFKRNIFSGQHILILIIFFYYLFIYFECKDKFQ